MPRSRYIPAQTSYAQDFWDFVYSEIRARREARAQEIHNYIDRERLAQGLPPINRVLHPDDYRLWVYEYEEADTLADEVAARRFLKKHKVAQLTFDFYGDCVHSPDVLQSQPHL